jgi:1,6-anhydro-N-acetylmuramate kinase
MTGTSIDGIDAAIVRVEGAGLDMRATLVHRVSRELRELADPLRRAADQTPMTAAAFARLAAQFGRMHADVIADAMDGLNIPLDLVSLHGQTVVHEPPISWQLIDPAPVAERLGCPVVSDLRAADLAAGGRGAPITPIADWVLFRDDDHRRAIVNLGGFCNVTGLPAARGGAAADVRGADVCACNHVLDAVARTALGAPYDEGGRAAANGSLDERLTGSLQTQLDAQRRAGRALGTGDELTKWVAKYGPGADPLDLAASAVKAIASTIAVHVAPSNGDQLVVAGGGARNATLVETLRRHAGVDTMTSDALGIPVEAREAVAMAVLGALSADGVPITIPAITGCSDPAPVAGRWTGVTRPAAT